MASASRLASRSFQDFIDYLNQDDDPRVGSGREDSDGGGTLSGENGSKGASLSKLGATFIPISIYVAVCLIVFIIARRKLPRVYAPRTIPALRAPEAPSPALPNGWFNWIIPFFKTPDTYVLNHGSLDGFFFLRYLKVLRNISFAGCLVAWPILFPLHATGGGDKEELEILTIGNVKDSKRLYANAIVAWLLFGFVLFTVARESVYYVNMRQAYLSSPYYSQRLSSRTVLFTSVPQRYLDEARIRKLYGDSVRRVWLPRTSRKLVNLVKEREQTALRLEKAQIELIKKANAVRRKQLQGNSKQDSKNELNHSNDESRLEEGSGPTSPVQNTATTGSDEGEAARILSNCTGEVSIEPAEAEKDDIDPPTSEASLYTHPYGLKVNIPDVRGSVAAQYVPAENRPSHRPIGKFGQRTDTIRWTLARLKELNKDIKQTRKRLKSPYCKSADKIPVAFVEFDSQEAAQAAHQVIAHHQPLHMAPRLLGIRPDEVVWGALRIKWLERIIRRFAIMGLIVAAVIFWSIPSAIVGVISNIQSLSKIPFLRWLQELPSPVLGFLTGFMPALALSLFMAMVPVMLRACARFAGVQSLTMVELFTQTAYFAFQVVQVFLITTLTSAASNAFIDVVMDPMSAKDVLAENIPAASNFYISYILIQCLANAGTAILQPFDLIRHGVLGLVAQMPRSRYRLWHTVRPTRWGRDFPVFANLGVIAMAYACISPLILIFSALGMWFTYTVWRYNLIYVLNSDMDSKGLCYPRALTHLTVGLYLAEFCLVGLFFLNDGFGPAVLMILLLVVTALVHFSITQAVYPLLHNLPQSLGLEEEFQMEDKAAAEAALRAGEIDGSNGGGAASSYYDTEQAFGDEDDDLGSSSDEDDTPEPAGNRALEGASNVRDLFTNVASDWVTKYTKNAAKEQADALGISLERDPDAGPSIISKWLNPHIHEDFIAIRKNLMTLPETLPEIGNDPRCSYDPPEMWQTKPILWIPQDEARVSRQEVAYTRDKTPISDQGAKLDEKGNILVEVEKAPFQQPRLIV